ncbi:MAG: efflux RND transporter periplasmic adaptor subunit [Bacteroidota bacterium]|nr:efflux RND transporter periplasmic adaptor subunit [Bacteroidota bacterium]
MIKITVTATLFLIGLTLFSSCNTDTKKPEEKAKYVISDSLFKTLKIDTVSECPVINSLTLTGQVSFNDSKVARIFPMVSGNISGVKVQVGDHVTKGQKLGVIRSGEMAGYGNDLVSSQTNLLIAKKNMDAAEDMYKGGLMSEKDFITAQQMYKQSQSQLTRSKEVLQINGGSTQGDYVVRAPISGFVVEKQINNNMTIRTDNANDLFTISDLENVWVWANVYESNISNVHLGDNVDVTTLSYPGKVFKGKVDQILNVLDPTNKVMKIRVVLSNPGYALKPQMFASVTVMSQTNQQGLCVPSDALTFNNSQYYILIYKSNSDVRIMPVQIISTNADKSYITGGLKAGDTIIGSNVVLIYEALNS